MNAFGVDRYQNWLPQLKLLQGIEIVYATEGKGEKLIAFTQKGMYMCTMYHKRKSFFWEVVRAYENDYAAKQIINTINLRLMLRST